MIDGLGVYRCWRLRWRRRNPAADIHGLPGLTARANLQRLDGCGLCTAHRLAIPKRGDGGLLRLQQRLVLRLLRSKRKCEAGSSKHKVVDQQQERESRRLVVDSRCRAGRCRNFGTHYQLHVIMTMPSIPKQCQIGGAPASLTGPPNTSVKRWRSTSGIACPARPG